MELFGGGVQSAQAGTSNQNMNQATGAELGDINQLFSQYFSGTAPAIASGVNTASSALPTTLANLLGLGSNVNAGSAPQAAPLSPIDFSGQAQTLTNSNLTQGAGSVNTLMGQLGGVANPALLAKSLLTNNAQTSAQGAQAVQSSVAGEELSQQGNQLGLETSNLGAQTTSQGQGLSAQVSSQSTALQQIMNMLGLGQSSVAGGLTGLNNISATSGTNANQNAAGAGATQANNANLFGSVLSMIFG